MRLTIALAVSAFVLVSGCGQAAAPDDQKGELPSLSPETVLRVHWIGKKELAIDGSAFYFNRMWDLEQTRVLENMILNKVAALPWKLLRGDEAPPNAPVFLCRWLLESLKYEESYTEVRAPADSRLQVVLAVRLSDDRHAMWQSNLAMVLNSASGVLPASSRDNPEGWSTVHPQTKDRLQLVRHGEWTVFTVAPDKAEFPRKILEHIDRKPNPFGATNRWLRADVNLNRVAQCLGRTDFFSGDPIVSLSLSGDGANVFTDVTVTFSEPLPGSIEPWELPGELIHEPLTSFAAARGIRPLLSQWAWWKAMPLGEPPNQMFAWSVRGSPFQVYLAGPMPEAEARMARLAEQLLTRVNPWLTNNGPSIGDSGVPLFEQVDGGKGVRWNIPGVWPFVTSVAAGGGRSFLMAGLTPENSPGKPMAARRFQEVLARTNLVYFEWESTPARLNDWLPVLQTTRVLAHRAPLPDECQSLKWMTALQHRLAEAETAVYRTAPNRLELHRKSTIGLTAAELHLLADWFESPRFPAGLHTFVAPPP